MDYNENIIDGAKTAFIDENHQSYEEFKPELIVNKKGEKVLNSIKEELQKCDEFYISVAFITMGGLTPLLQDLKELEERSIKGKILTTDYLNFTEPKALKKLNEFSNIEVKIYTEESEGFHTKGYIFKQGNIYQAIVGSSNLTMNALTINKEWNVGFSSLNNGEILNDIIHEFNDLWDKSKDIDDVIDEYESIYKHYKNFTRFNKNYIEIKHENIEDIEPNLMQKEFLKNLRKLIQKGENKALLVSATGTGKTYAAAFAVNDFKPKKFLFIVHREQIAKQAIKTFKKVFKNEDNKFGLLSGNSKSYDKDYIFSTIQTMSKDDVYTKFREDEFDYIVIDEVHKAGANSYLKILNYFKPKFILGMSASPDRTDNFNIYELFDYNVPLDIRLQDALDEDLLCPFHYFGISDLEINGKSREDTSDFNFLVSNDRVNYLIEKSEYYGYSGNRRKALGFCSIKKEAKKLAKEFTKRGYPSIALTGDNTQDEREEAINRLTNESYHDKIEFIFTVDIFNEGVDIPEVNQILLIRPTQSSIVFIQQLGRGLRKYENKEYVVIIDFIGNYKNNFLIPIALSGDKTFDKDNIRKYVIEGNKTISGSSSINFDIISKKRIYESINNTNFSKITLFKEKYQNLKFKLGRIPYLIDFYKNGEFDPSLILNHNSFDTYYNFLKKVEKDYDKYLSDKEIKSLKFITDNFSNGKRPHELIMLKLLIYNKYFTIKQVEDCLLKYNIENDFKSIKSSFNIFDFEFFVKNDKKKYENIKFFEFDKEDLENLSNFKNKEYKITKEFNEFINHQTYNKHLNDLIDYGLLKYEDKYNMQTEGVNLKLYEKYSRKDVCRLLNWPHDDSSTLYGYRIKHNTCPIFVTYEKKEDISSSTQYEDEFESKNIFSWLTRSNVKIESKEPQLIINNKDLKIHLFIKKHDSEGKDFYYIGQVKPIKWKETTIKNDKGQELPVVNFKYKLDNPIKEDLYNYFITEINDDDI
ncbi:NgoFVII family restriction endonuclease [Methanobrevibacter sp. 87.7]|uniref:DUF3427 domain-containing protein n=1 Tax=Methanobrevibacter sp. 87.7 TaxID=387957 RepID=UPI000B50600A|nr:DEAD/DEAH box helicase [Methanobrevibacter sp. 87.7]OWT33618.1 NgoFVII family restriction endonuclease [Methanobrevibacter sp. 87.7]